MAHIAFFGLGTMGLPMCLNLLKAGHQVHVMPHNGKMTGPLEARKHGAVIHDALESMTSQAEFVISVVPNDDAVRAIYLNETMKKSLRPGVIIIEMTSCTPETVMEVQEYYKDHEVSVLDAPITGALPRAIQGTLTILGAGEPQDFRKAQPVLSAMAETVFQLGEVGHGKLVKAMTNLLGAVNLAAVGEFYRFAAAMGLDMDQMKEVVAASAGGSTQFTRNFGRMVAGDYKPAFTLRLLRKDMGIALDRAAKQGGLSLPLSELAYKLYQRASSHDEDDCSSIARINDSEIAETSRPGVFPRPFSPAGANMIAQKNILAIFNRFEELAGVGAPVCVCVTDEHGFVLGYAQMDGASSRAFPMARAKAYTAARLRQTTARFHERLLREQLSLADFNEPYFTSLKGGVPVFDADNRILGGVAVSGREPEEDEALATRLASMLVERL